MFNSECANTIECKRTNLLLNVEKWICILHSLQEQRFLSLNKEYPTVIPNQISESRTEWMLGLDNEMWISKLSVVRIILKVKVKLRYFSEFKFLKFKKSAKQTIISIEYENKNLYPHNGVTDDAFTFDLFIN